MDRAWRRTVTCLAGMVVFVTTYAMILPAISMARGHPTVSAEMNYTESGGELGIIVTADAESRERLILLMLEGEGADLSPAYDFSEEGVCTVTDREGQEILLHRLDLAELRASAAEDSYGTAGGFSAGVPPEEMTAFPVGTEPEELAALAAGLPPEALAAYWYVLPADTASEFTLELLDGAEGRFDITGFPAGMVPNADDADSAEHSATASDASREGPVVTASDSDAGPGRKLAGAKSEKTNTAATASDAERGPVTATGSDAELIQSGLILTEEHDDGFTELLDGPVIDNLDHSGEADTVEETETSALQIAAAVKISAGEGESLEEALRDILRNAEKRGDAVVRLAWTESTAVEEPAAGAEPEVESATESDAIPDAAVLPEEITLTAYLDDYAVEGPPEAVRGSPETATASTAVYLEDIFIPPEATVANALRAAPGEESTFTFGIQWRRSGREIPWPQENGKPVSVTVKLGRSVDGVDDRSFSETYVIGGEVLKDGNRILPAEAEEEDGDVPALEVQQVRKTARMSETAAETAVEKEEAALSMAYVFVLRDAPPGPEDESYEYFVTEDQDLLPEGYRLSNYSLGEMERTDYAPDGYSIVNSSEASVTLPETGGPGTAGHTAAGLLLMTFAAWLLAAFRPRTGNQMAVTGSSAGNDGGSGARGTQRVWLENPERKERTK